MPKGPETKLATKIRRALVNHGGDNLYIFKMHGGPHSVPGVPDFICCYRGWFVSLEVKTPKGKPTEKQKYHLEKIQKAGGYSAIVRSPQEALAVLTAIDILEDGE